MNLRTGMSLRLLAIQAVAATALTAQISMVTNRYDQYTTGADTQETTLTAANVNANGFGKLWSYYVDGAVYAQPLYLPSVQIPGHGGHNVLYAASMSDEV